MNENHFPNETLKEFEMKTKARNIPFVLITLNGFLSKCVFLIAFFVVLLPDYVNEMRVFHVRFCQR